MRESPDMNTLIRLPPNRSLRYSGIVLVPLAKYTGTKTHPSNKTIMTACKIHIHQRGYREKTVQLVFQGLKQST